MQRENGLYTYFASDIAYHPTSTSTRFRPDHRYLGADHHGYIPRVKGALAALGLPAPVKLEVALVQFAVLYRNGQKASMRPPGRANSSPCARLAVKSATTPAASSMCCARPISTSISISAAGFDQRESVYYIPVCPCADCQRAEASGGGGSRRELARCRHVAAGRRARTQAVRAPGERSGGDPAAAKTTRRTRWPSTRTPPAISAAGTTPTACWSRTKASLARLRSLRRFVRRSRTACACSAYPHPEAM